MKPSISQDEKDLEEQENLLSRTSQDSISTPIRRSSRNQLPVYLISALTLLVGVALGVLLGSKLVPERSDGQCVTQLSGYSAVTEDVDIKYSPVRYNGSFMHEDIYRRRASPEVDAAWEGLGVNYRALIVPEDRAMKAGLRPDQVRVNPKYGGGYPANVEGLHHLHCLNLIRQGLKWNYNYYQAKGEGAFTNSEYVVELHITHCLDIIRQQLMCSVDLGVLGQVWYNETEPTPFVDFNTVHQCRNFDAIRQWAEERQAPEFPPEDYIAPPREGQYILPEMP